MMAPTNTTNMSLLRPAPRARLAATVIMPVSICATCVYTTSSRSLSSVNASGPITNASPVSSSITGASTALPFSALTYLSSSSPV